MSHVYLMSEVEGNGRWLLCAGDRSLAFSQAGKQGYRRLCVFEVLSRQGCRCGITDLILLERWHLKSSGPWIMLSEPELGDPSVTPPDFWETFETWIANTGETY